MQYNLFLISLVVLILVFYVHCFLQLFLLFMHYLANCWAYINIVLNKRRWKLHHLIDLCIPISCTCMLYVCSVMFFLGRSHYHFSNFFMLCFSLSIFFKILNFIIQIYVLNGTNTYTRLYWQVSCLLIHVCIKYL